jgi:hypothetical protein
MRQGPPKRIVCVVEGKGEVKAIPNLCARVLKLLDVSDWYVDPEPIRQPRSRLVDERVPSPLRPAREGGFDDAVQLALRSRRANGVLVLCDSDDDCPATWGTVASARLGQHCRGAAVMAVREYEAWLLHGLARAASLRAPQIDAKRDAKGLLRRYVPGYRPNLHQLEITRELDIGRCWARSDSFDKLVRSLAAITGAPVPARPPA